MKKYICFMDFEYTCTGDTEYDFDNDKVEIISIAGVIIDKNNQTVDEFHEIVRPIKNVVIHPFCTELTGITQDMVDDANFFSSVSENFMEFISPYENESLYFYSWGNTDAIAIEKTLQINRYNGDFEYVKNKLVNIQKRICCNITYKQKPFKSIWSLQDVKRVYNLVDSNNAHNALIDARDLRDIYIAYKGNFPRNYEYIKFIYEKFCAMKILKYFNKDLNFDYIPGDLKYGLANLFQATSPYDGNNLHIKFNKKTMMFENFEYTIENNDEIQSIIKNTEIIRYSKVKMKTEFKYMKEMIGTFPIERPTFTITFSAISTQFNKSYEINEVYNIPFTTKTVKAIGIFVRTMKRYDKLYDVNKTNTVN